MSLSKVVVGAAALTLTLPSLLLARDFHAPRAIRLAREPRALAVADFDEDGRLDVAVGTDGGVEIHFPADDALDVFRPYSGPPLSVRAGEALAAGDVDADGHADLAVGSVEGVTIHFGDGLGGFVSVAVTSGPSSHCVGVALPDLDQDGFLDVAALFVSTPAFRTSLQDSIVPRAFRPGPVVSVSLSFNPRLVAGDIDRDSLQDFAIVLSGLSRVECVFSDGFGGVSSPAVAVPLPRPPNDAVVADANGDGFGDLVVGYDAGVRVFLANSQRAFTRFEDLPVTGAVLRLALGDANGDGQLDVAAHRRNDPGFAIFYGGPGGGSGRGDLLLHTGVFEAAAIADLARDGLVEVLAADRTGRRVVVFPGSPDGPIHATAIRTHPAENLLAQDFDGDGHADFAFGTNLIGRTVLRVTRLDGDGGVLSNSTLQTRGLLTEIASADYDADGLADVVGSASQAGFVTLLVNEGGAFRDAGNVFTGSGPFAPLAGDFDGDGRPDAAAGFADGTIRCAHGDGNSTFSRPSSAVIEGAIGGAAAGDVDGDGIDDVVVASRDAGRITLLLGSPNGEFDEVRLEAPSLVRPEAPVVADFDGDSLDDALILDSSRAEARLVHGDAARAFERSTRVDLFAEPDRGLAADFDADGRLDVAILEEGGRGLVTFLFGDGTGAFPEALRCALPPGDAALAAADLDEDGIVDLALQSPFAQRVSIFVARRADPRESLVGTVDRANGPPAPVLFVNDATGGPRREMTLVTHAPIVVFVDAPPAAAGRPSPFALWALAGRPTDATITEWPLGIGRTAFPPRRLAGGPVLAIWNNTGVRALGVPSVHSRPAPSELFRLRAGTRRPITFTLQGVIADPGSRAERPASVTNGVIVDVR